MAAGNTCIADLIDTVRYEMDSAAHIHRVHKSVWSPVIGE